MCVSMPNREISIYHDSSWVLTNNLYGQIMVVWVFSEREKCVVSLTEHLKNWLLMTQFAHLLKYIKLPAICEIILGFMHF